MVFQLDEAAKRQLSCAPNMIPACLEYLAAREIERLIEALDDLLETCELNGMHGDKTYQRSKAVCNEAMGHNTVYIPGVGDFLTRPTGHPHDPTTPEQEDEISSAMDVTSEVRALLREADVAIVRRDMVGFRAAMQIAQEYLSGMKF